MKDLFKELPFPFKVWFVLAPILGLSFAGFIVWAIWRFVAHFT